MEFAGKIVLVTGASSGIGERIAERFAALGAGVAVNSSKSREAGTALAERIGGIYCQADIADDQAVRSMIDKVIDSFGRLDVVVNNAGYTQVIPHDDLDSVTDELWERIFNVNVLGAWHVSRAAVPYLRKADNPCITNVTSIAGIRPIGSSIPYAVSKAGLNHMTRLLAKALGPAIRVNAVAPGLVDTPWTADWDEVRAFVTSNVPMHRPAVPDDVAEACLYLARSNFVTGDLLVVDGGHQLI
ncbi:MAG: glucose 1-dehydrogenase [Acidimicrobiia bacterium]|nr:glucose 1-dehydrogenase [Acidimicrobiia bacterium]